MTYNKLFHWALGALCFPLALAAQSVRWEPAGGPIAAGQTTTLQLIFDGCEPKDTPAPPKVDGLTLQYSGQSTAMSFVNGTYSHTITYNFAALLTRSQRVVIPSFAVETDKGSLRVPAARFDPAAATVGGGQPLAVAANSRLEAPPIEVWAGEVFPLSYSIQAARSYYPDFGHGAFDWNPDPLMAEDWTQPVQFDISPGGEPQVGLIYRTRAIAHKSGSIRLSPVNQLVNLSVGVTGFGFFQQRQYQQFSVASDAVTIQVRPLPPAPAGFSGAVGDFKLSAKIVPAKAAVGEPITWTLELSGTGNWPDIPGLPEREVSKNFQVIQPKAKRTTPDKKLFDSKLTEDVVLVPTQSGRYDLRPVRFIYFDPKSGAYKTLETPPAAVEVAPAAAANGSPSAGAAPAPAAPAVAAHADAPELPSGLPRDPLTESEAAAVPLSGRTVIGLCLAPFGLLLIFWFWLAARRARQTDPVRFRREARLRLAATLGKLQTGAAPAAPHLLAWQRDAAVLWEINHAAPTAPAMVQSDWAGLWAEADRVLYGGDPALPANWTGRARALLAAKPVPAFALRRIFRPRNLFPFLVLALMAGAGAPAVRSAEAGAVPAVSPASAYRSGDFAAAEAAWRRTLARTPADWTARYNLSIALAQQNRWDEAAAQAAAAFVQKPDDDAVRWQFALACGKAGFVPGPLADFLPPGPVPWLARCASPATWQGGLGIGAGLAAVACGLLLAIGYGVIRRGPYRVVALAALGLSVLIMLAASLGWAAFGAAADTRSVVVWRQSTLRSIPTEADSSQKTTPLAAGSLGRADKDFLGWIRLAFANGQTGWVRKEEAVWLWK